MDISHLKDYYTSHDENGRLLTKSGQVEFLTTMRYIQRFLKPNMRILEIGAGTGRYSLTLAHKGYQVDAVELLQENLQILRQGIQPADHIMAIQGNALDLSVYPDNTFDMTLVLGPMYHLYTMKDQIAAMHEALRVTKKAGVLFVAYCMNEATILQYGFLRGQIHYCHENHMITEDYHCLSQPKDLFQLMRIEDIENINRQLPVERLYLLASDGPTCYLRSCIEEMDEKTFALYLDYHFRTCERQDLIGASNHSLDILKKKA